MKIGTDALLLGAISKLIHTHDLVLEIGSGCGIITLMMAKIHSDVHFTCVDIDNEAIKESRLNFKINGFHNSCVTIRADISEYASKNNYSYDVIVSNPPYFSSEIKPLSQDLLGAKHTTTLSMQQLSKSVGQLLKIEGVFYVILPPSEAKELIDSLEEYGITLKEIWEIKSLKDHPTIRNILTFRKNENKDKIILKQFIIYGSAKRNDWSEQYKELLQEFKIF